MTNTNQQVEQKVKFIFRLLPIIGILCLVAGLGWAIYKLTFDVTAYSLMGVGVLFFLTLFLKAELANLKFYLHIVFYSVLVTGICVVGYMFARQYAKKVDLTEDKMYSLSDLSEKSLKRLDKDVTVTVFDLSPDAYREVKELYTGVTNKVTWKFFNARTQPSEAAKFGETVQNGDIFIKSGKNQKRLSRTEVQQNFENSLTNAIIEVTRTGKIKIYFVTGHGELAYDQPESASREERQQRGPSLAAFKNFLTERAIDTAKLDLGQSGFVPEDASMVVVAGPKADMVPSEVAALEAYLKKNGHVMVLVDVAGQENSDPLKNLTGLLKKYGIETPDKVVLDVIGAQLTGDLAQISAGWFNPDQPITQDLAKRGSRINFLTARPLQTAQAPEGMAVTELIKSSERSWAEDIKALMVTGKPNPPPVSQMTPQTVGVAVAKSAPPAMPGQPKPKAEGGTRLVVFGSSMLIQDTFLAVNRQAVDMMLNTINWLTEQDDLIAVPPRQLKGTPIILDNNQLRLIFVFSVVLLPAGLFFGGVSYSMLRRRK